MTPRRTASGNPYITPSLFRFFEELSRNNNREWFQENKKRYEETVQIPLLAFISDFEPELHTISRHLVADTRKTGKSLFRIYRDIRFSPDKRPCKEHAGVHFPHVSGSDAHAPGFYLHLAPNEIFAGAGIWRPDPKALKRIRLYIADHPDQWSAVRKDPKLRRTWTLSDEDKLTRPPMGFDADHPHIEDLKLKSFVLFAELSRKEVCAADFPRKFTRLCASASGFTRFLTNALDLAW